MACTYDSCIMDADDYYEHISYWIDFMNGSIEHEAEFT